MKQTITIEIEIDTAWGLDDSQILDAMHEALPGIFRDIDDGGDVDNDATCVSSYMDGPTEDEIHQRWRDEVLPCVRETYEQDGIPDIPARSESYNDWTSGLLDDGEITERDYNEWGSPAECYR